MLAPFAIWPRFGQIHCRHNMASSTVQSEWWPIRKSFKFESYFGAFEFEKQPRIILRPLRCTQGPQDDSGLGGTVRDCFRIGVVEPNDVPILLRTFFVSGW